MLKRWTAESWIMTACFAAVWVYFLVWIVERKLGNDLSNWWQLILLPVLAVALVIMARRISRIKKEIAELQDNPGMRRR